MTPAATRARWFCSLCGALITKPPRMVDGFARCRAHADLPSEDGRTPRDPLAALPPQAVELRQAVRDAGSEAL